MVSPAASVGISSEGGGVVIVSAWTHTRTLIYLTHNFTYQE